MKLLSNTSLIYLLNKIKNNFFRKSEAVEVTTLSIDSTPTINSDNLITSGAVYDALEIKEKEDYFAQFLTYLSPGEYAHMDTQPLDWDTNKTAYYTYNSSTEEYEPVQDGATWASHIYYRLLVNEVVIDGIKSGITIPAEFYIPSHIVGYPVTEIIVSQDNVHGIFEGNTVITKLFIPDTIKVIGYHCCKNATSLKEIHFGNSIEILGGSAFYGCVGLTNLIFPDTLKVLNYRCFYGCTGLTTLVLPKSVQKFGDGTYEGDVFHGCTGLTSIIVPDGVQILGNNIFYECTNLVSVTIPKSIQTIGASAFSQCSSLSDVYYAGTQTEWSNITFEGTGHAYIIAATKHYNQISATVDYVNGGLSAKEDKSNKTDTISSQSTDIQYPSAEAVYTALQYKFDKSGGQLTGKLVLSPNSNSKIKTGLGQGTFFEGEYSQNILGWDYAHQSSGTSPALKISNNDKNINLITKDGVNGVLVNGSPILGGDYQLIESYTVNTATSNFTRTGYNLKRILCIVKSPAGATATVTNWYVRSGANNQTLAQFYGNVVKPSSKYASIELYNNHGFWDGYYREDGGNFRAAENHLHSSVSTYPTITSLELNGGTIPVDTVIEIYGIE